MIDLPRSELKTRVLLYWDVTRKDLLVPFIDLKDKIDFVIIWGEEAYPDNHPFPQIFAHDFSTPYQLLKKINPHKVLFFNLNSFPQIAINLAAKNMGITTYVMHHGIHHSDYIELNNIIKKHGIHKKRKLISNFSTLMFYFSALRIKNLRQIPKYFQYACVRQIKDRLTASQEFQFDSRMPDFYINLSPHNAIIAKRLDGIEDDNKFLYIGHPFFDKIITRLNELKKSVEKENRYFLLIDFPNNENVLTFKYLGAEGKRRFYQRLSALAALSGYRLKIKLHPSGYKSPYNYKDHNIDLIYDTDLAILIHNAETCFSFFSTLLIPIIFSKKHCYIFTVGEELQLQKELSTLGLVSILDIERFNKRDISIKPPKKKESNFQIFVERYLYYTDGKSTCRLKEILQYLPS